MALRTIKPNEYTVSVTGTAGSYTLRDWETIDIEYDEPELYQTFPGASGESTRVRNVNRMATVTINLRQGSTDNASLQAFQILGETGSGSDVFTMSLNGGNSQSSRLITEAWVNNRPSESLTRTDDTPVSWQIRGVMDRVLAGHLA